MEPLDLNQMVGIVRNEAAKARVYLHMDQILTTVLEAENRVADATKRLEDIERQCQNKSMSLAAMEAQYDKREAELRRHLETMTEEATERAERIERDAYEEAEKVRDELRECKEAKSIVLEDIANLNDTLKALQLEERNVREKVRNARNELASLRQKLDN